MKANKNVLEALIDNLDTAEGCTEDAWFYAYGGCISEDFTECARYSARVALFECGTLWG